MIPFEIEQLIPEFLRNDKNGYAIAKALEAGLTYFLARAQDGLDCLQNIEKMPEWRLDELAWELGCLYDYQANIEAKRRWIKDATPLFSSYGTPQAIYNFLEGYFDQVLVEENWQYGGEPYHFRVWVSGELTKEKQAWALNAIAQAKNVRSVMDDMSIGSGVDIQVKGVGEVVARVRFPLCGEMLAGQWPQA